MCTTVGDRNVKVRLSAEKGDLSDSEICTNRRYAEVKVSITNKLQVKATESHSQRTAKLTAIFRRNYGGFRQFDGRRLNLQKYETEVSQLVKNQ